MTIQEKTNWILRGYKDCQDKTLYKNSPKPTPPELPDHMLPEEWKLYFEGFFAGNQDAVNKILSK